jgi:hypothetical protein
MDLLVLFGPPASGKMSVGRRIAQRTRYRLLHNHLTIEPLLGLWDFHDRAFRKLSGDLRRAIVREAIADDRFDLVFTYVWALDEPDEWAFLESMAEPVRRAGGTVRYAELVCGQAERLRRNRGEERLDHKRSKRDLAWSDDNLRSLDADYRLSSHPGELDERLRPYVRVDNEAIDPEEAAERVIAGLGLPVTPY